MLKETPTTQSSIGRLLVFSDDWGRHPSSCQHLVNSLLRDTEVTWVNTIGMRPPRLDSVTIKRGMEKIQGWFRQGSDSVTQDTIPPNLSLVDAKMWPWMTHEWDRWLNGWLLSKQLFDASRNSTIVTTIPIVADLVGRLPAKRWIYYCVDDFSAWPGLDQDVMRTMEQRLLKHADRVIAVSETLREKILQERKQCDLLTHGVHLQHWNGAVPAYDWLRHGIDGPVYLFWGVIDQRMDVSWLSALNDRMDCGNIVLVGPEQNPARELGALSRLKRIGAVSYEELPSMAAAADVLIMPYEDSEVTRAMQPLKMKEYLATGKPVVARMLPSIEEWDDCADLVSDSQSFATAVLTSQPRNTNPSQTSNRERLTLEGWESKANQFQQFITAN